MDGDFAYQCSYPAEQMPQPGRVDLAEVAYLRPVLEAPGEARKMPGDHGIETWAKRHKGHWYVIAVNSSEKPLTSAIDVSALGVSGDAQVLFEDGRMVATMDGKINDQFTADAAHVYKVASK